MRGGGVITLVGLLAAALLAAPAQAAPTDRAEALAAYEAVQRAQAVPAGWSGSVDGCVVGTESEASREATLATVNTLRSFAGIAPVALDPARNDQALAAALMMRAAGRLSHNPGPDWPCYSESGKQGAATSNLFLGLSGPAAMVGYVDDAGVDSLGHRRWLLDPAATRFGTGSTGTTNALSVIGGERAPVPAGSAVAWPPAGWVPWPWVFDDWSISVAGGSLAGAQVSVALDGSPVPVRDARVLGKGFGTGETLAWRVDLPAAAGDGDHRLDVRITGAGAPIEYAVNAFAPEGAAPPPDGSGPPDAAACAAARAKLDAAKDRLRELRRKGAGRAKVKRAKAKVKRARERARAACA